jgi:hypothetical protein
VLALGPDLGNALSSSNDENNLRRRNFVANPTNH